jgi:phage-related holin
MISLLEKLINAPTWKAGLMLIFGTFAQFITPIGDFIFLIIFLITADLITGIWAAKKRGELINSSGFRRTFQKVVVYALCIIVAEYIRIVMFKDLQINVAYPIAILIVITEFKSISENALTITGIDIWAKIKDLLPTKS